MNDVLVLKIIEKLGISEKEFWQMVKEKQATGISEEGAIRMIANETAIGDSGGERNDKPSEFRADAGEKKYHGMTISSLTEGSKAVIRAAIVQIFETKNIFFYACPVCGKSVKGDSCTTHPNEMPQLSMKLSCVLDDGTGNIRAILFANALQTILGMSVEDAKTVYDREMTSLRKSIPMGKDYIFVGNVHLNSFFGKNELVVGNVKNVSVLDELAKIGNILYGVNDEKR